MSIISTVYLPEGIIMAADSRLTFDKIENGNKVTYTGSDNEQKVFLLSKVDIGISYCGNAHINGQTIADYLRIFEIKELNNDDSVITVSEKLYKYLNGIMGTMFLVAGYYEDESYIFDVNGNKNERTNILTNGTITYGATWNGKGEAIAKVIKNDPALPINFDLMPLKDGIDFAEFLVDLTIKYERFNDNIQTCGGPIDILVINKDDAFWYQHKIYKPKQ